PGSAIGHPPLFTAATSASSTSQPITEAPFRANWAARGRPILPRPITAIVRSLAFISNLLGTHGEAGSAGLGEGVGDRDGGEGIAIVGDEQPAVAEHGEVADLLRRQPVDVDEADRAIAFEADETTDCVFKGRTDVGPRFAENAGYLEAQDKAHDVDVVEGQV